MGYKLNEDLILRQEFFGGLIHSKNSAEKWETTNEFSAFFWLLEQIGDPGKAVDLVNLAFPGSNFKPDINLMLQEGFIVPVAGMKVSCEENSLTKNIIQRVNEARSRGFLKSPIALSIYPQTQCDLSCDFCFVDAHKKIIKTVDCGKWIKLIREAATLDVVNLSILGGEPTLYKGIKEILEEVELLRITSTITTNGNSLEEEVFSLLARSKHITTAISLQSVGDFHFRVTGQNPCKPIATIKRFSNVGKSCRINTVYLGQTVQELIEIAELCIEQGVETFIFNLYSRNAGQNLEELSVAEFAEMAKKASDQIAKLPGADKLQFTPTGCMSFPGFLSGEEGCIDESDKFHNKSFLGCDAGQAKLEVLPNGQPLPCILFDKESAGLSLFETGLQRYWDNDPFLKTLRNLENKDQRCNCCSHYHFCNGGCPSLNLTAYGNMDTIGDMRCHLRERRKE